MKKIITITGLAMLALASCQKDANPEPDPTKININLTSPNEGQLFKRGSSVPVTGEISYTGELHGYELRITNLATGKEVFSDDEHQHSDHFTLNSSWTDTCAGSVPLKLEVTVEIDHDGHEKTTEVQFRSEE